MKYLSRFSWLIVVTAALTLSAWNLLIVGHAYGLPYVIAGIVSLVFDGTALRAAILALSYSAQGDSGATPRMVVLIMAGASAYLGSQHAVIAHDPAPARIAFGMPALAAITLAELELRWKRRNALRKQDRLPGQLPRFGRETWILFPVRSLSTLRRVVGRRLTLIENQGVAAACQDRTGDGTGIGKIKVPPASRDRSPASRDRSPASRDRSPASRDRSPASDRATVRQWARLQGFPVSNTGRIPIDVLKAYESAFNMNGETAA